MRKRLVRFGLGLLGLFTLVVVAALALGWSAFGKRATGERRVRMEHSKEWDGSKFENPQPLWNDASGMWAAMTKLSPVVSPRDPVPVVRGDEERFATNPESGLRVTWFGHSTTLVEVDGVKLLTDPVWSMRPSPYSFVGPQRWYEPVIALEKMPHPDAVLISHDHYDHLDEGTIRALAKWPEPLFFCALGVGAHLEYWGVPKDRIVELDWWEEREVKGVRIVSTPARHASGRWLTDMGGTLWTSWSMVGPAHRVWFSGDTGLFPAMTEIGEKYGPFDLTMIEVGQYNRAWPDWHIGPEQAVRAHGMVKGKVMLPVHWGLLQLAAHGWTEPVERALVAAALAGVTLMTPKPGQSVDPTLPTRTEKWWPLVEWEDAKKHPIVSTKVDASSPVH